MSIGPNTSDGSVNRVRRYSKYSPSGILSASLNLITRSDFAVPGGPTSSSGSWATAATHIRSISDCLATKNRPSARRKRLIRSRSVEASRARSSAVRLPTFSTESWAATAVLILGPFSSYIPSEITVQTTPDQVLVVLDEATTGLAEREVVGRDAEHE